jgi:hypothetical protein
MPGVSGVTVVTNACAFYTPHAAAGASSARHSLRPLISEGRTFRVKLAQITRENAKLWLVLFEKLIQKVRATTAPRHHPPKARPGGGV